MIYNILDISHLLIFFLILGRVAGAVMLMPAIGDNIVPARIKIILSVLLTIIIIPIVTYNIQATFTQVDSRYFFLISQEIIIGIFIGLVSKFLIGSLHIAGSIISMQSGLSSAALFNMSQNSQSSIEGILFLNLAMALFFIHNLHHMFILGLIDTYNIFPFIQKTHIADTAEFLSNMINKIAAIAFKISSPFLIINTSIFITAGILARLMPNIQIFYLMTPIQMLISFFVMLNVITPIILWYMELFAEILQHLNIS